jgi:uncharacterized protein (TIGR03435 family)
MHAWIVLLLMAQSGTAPVEFDVASVKPAEMGDGMSMSGGCKTEPVRLTCTNMSLKALVSQAYNLKRNQVSGPGWLDTERYDVAVKFPAGTTPEQFRAMMQNLLATRFMMALHHEAKEMQIYELVVAKNGPKLKTPSKDPAPVAPEAAPPANPYALADDGYPVLPPGKSGTRMTNGRARMQQFATTMENFASELSGAVGQSVKDATGLKGEYTLAFTFATGPAPDDFTGPTIFEALQSQLGLKLERAKGTLDTLVIDRAEKIPTAN